MTTVTQNSNASVLQPCLKGEIFATTCQVAILNSHMPYGYRLELSEDLLKQNDSHSKSAKRKKPVFPALNLCSPPRSQIFILERNMRLGVTKVIIESIKKRLSILNKFKDLLTN